MNKWTLHITEFGKIEKADVSTAPMTFFVGDNNSGKSYLMTLIYGLLDLQIFFRNYNMDETSEEYQKCRLILEKIFETLELDQIDAYVLAGEEKEAFEKLLNIILHKNMDRFLSQLFNKQMEIGNLTIEFPKNSSYEFVTSSYRQDRKSLYCKDSSGEAMSGYVWTRENRDADIRCRFFIAYILESMLKKDFNKAISNKAVYFPTARTGYLLTYKTLSENAMQEKFSVDKRNENFLTKPNVDFLSYLSGLSVQYEDTEFEEIVHFIEKNIIGGHLQISDLPAKDFMYVPEGQDQPLPMYVTSGVVTEMTPILLFLKYGGFQTMLIEEPEISLHPKLQIEITRALIRCVNMGMPVFVTTHSDIMIQHINNMIKLSKAPDQKKLLDKLGYEDDDILKREDIEVYQFHLQPDNKSKVERVACGEYGFEARTFYDTLCKLNEQIDLIEGTEEE